MSNTIKSTFCVLQNGIEIQLNIKKFKDGAIQVETGSILDPSSIIIKAMLKDSDGIIVLHQLKQIIDAQLKNIRVDLHLLYNAYGRYDRNMTGSTDCFSLKVFSTLINNLKFNTVTLYDPHSQSSSDLLNNCITIEQQDCVQLMVDQNIIDPKVYDFIICPDAGAFKKCQKVAKQLSIPHIINCGKIRNVTTGEITGTEVFTSENLKDKAVICFDDLGEGLRTFTEVSKVLKFKGVSRFDLYITHGLLVNGVDCFEGMIDNIYSYLPWFENIADKNMKGILKFPVH